MTTAVALENRPKAIPEFWTWWIENGPNRCTRVVERELARDDVLRHLVGGDGGERDDRERRSTARRSAESERSATEIGAKRVRRRRADATSAAELARSAPLVAALVVDAESRPGNRLEAFLARSPGRSAAQRPYVPSSILLSAASICRQDLLSFSSSV